MTLPPIGTFTSDESKNLPGRLEKEVLYQYRPEKESRLVLYVPVWPRQVYIGDQVVCPARL